LGLSLVEIERHSRILRALPGEEKSDLGRIAGPRDPLCYPGRLPSVEPAGECGSYLGSGCGNHGESMLEMGPAHTRGMADVRQRKGGIVAKKRLVAPDQIPQCCL